MTASPDSMNSVTTGQALVAALARQSWDELAACFGDVIQFRALIPKGLRSADDRGGAVGYLRKWFGDADRLILLDSDVRPVQDRLHISYRFRAHEDQWYLVEQHAYCVMEDGLIKQLDLLCSGFRPEAASES